MPLEKPLEKSIERPIKKRTRESLLSAYSFPKKSLSIYLHFPWCLQKCHYCDFYSLALDKTKKISGINTEFQDMIKAYQKAVLRELILRLSDKESSFREFETVSSIFFGGGTPSLLPIETIAAILSAVRQEFTLAPECEICLEGNPENLTPEYLSALSPLVNRVNVGIQSLDQKILESMNRFYSKERYSSILHDLQASPLSNFGIDLIYGFPGQTEDSFYKDLAEVLSICNPPHLSIYSLTAEANTVYGQAVQKKTALAPNEDLQIEIWKSLPKNLSEAGLSRYEVSNFAKEGHWSLHNLRYWLYEPYLGLGPGAHGFDGSRRYANPRNLHNWLDKPAQSEYVLHDPLFEVPLMLLRLCGPVPLNLWKKVLLQKCKLAPKSLQQAQDCLEEWNQKGWIKYFSVLDRECSQDFQCFQWQKKGLSFLNDRILEMHSALA